MDRKEKISLSKLAERYQTGDKNSIIDISPEIEWPATPGKAAAVTMDDYWKKVAKKYGLKI